MCRYIPRLSTEAVRLTQPSIGWLSKSTRKWKINDKGQGFSEFAMGEKFVLVNLRPLHKTSEIQLFRAQIAFSEALDGLFNVRTNKSRFSIDDFEII